MTDPEQLAATIADETSDVLIGMDDLVEQLTISLLTRGHVLLEGVPGVAKTTLANTFARASGLTFTRVQMTPDILPADITGTTVYRQETGEFELQRGPIFANVVVADEINRATPKTQSALLEAMEERRVSIEGETLVLPEPFMVVATQNPIEQEGTYPLPEAQVDRFMLKIDVTYPTGDEELEIMRRMARTDESASVDAVASPEQILQARTVINDLYIDERVEQYIVNLVLASRDPGAYGLGELEPLLEYGASPRASINLNLAARAHAFLRHRAYVTPEDVRAVAQDVMQHRLVITYEAEAEQVAAADLVDRILGSVEVP